jgi:hypothetical protein
VSPKAGRTLVYKMSDVAKMYQHWNIAIPDFVKEICDGKVSNIESLQFQHCMSSQLRHTCMYMYMYM